MCMLNKKTLLAGMTVAALSLPGIASALSLDVFNSTNEDSTVRIAQSGLCSGRGHMTPAHGESHTSKAKVKMLCLLYKKCDAVMYPSDNCSGRPVAHMSMNTDTLETTSIVIDDPRYRVSTSGTRVNIDYAG